jgi:uncharacterized protein (DUF2147 family)
MMRPGTASPPAGADDTMTASRENAMRSMPSRGRVLTLAALAVAAFAVSPDRALAQDTPVGTWKQYDDRKGDVRSIIRIEAAGAGLIGTIVKVFPRPGEPEEPKCEKCPDDFKDKPVVGLRFLWGLTGSGRTWDGGRVLDPDEGKIYRVKLRLSEDGKTLDVRGFIGLSLFGRTQRWVRMAE